MNELANVLNKDANCLLGKVTAIHMDVNVEGLRNTLCEGLLTIVPSSDGDISIVHESGDAADYSRQSGNFDLHKDGLYCMAIPHFVLLGCEDPGRGDTPTVIVDTRPVAEEIERRPDLQVLKELELVYRSRDGREHARELIQVHPLRPWPTVNVGARTYVRPRVRADQPGIAPSLREMTTALSEMYRLLYEAVVVRHWWQKGDILLFDNNCFVHGREAVEVDFKRRLLRVWMSMQKNGRIA